MVCSVVVHNGFGYLVVALAQANWVRDDVMKLNFLNFQHYNVDQCPLSAMCWVPVLGRPPVFSSFPAWAELLTIAVLSDDTIWTIFGQAAHCFFTQTDQIEPGQCQGQSANSLSKLRLRHSYFFAFNSREKLRELFLFVCYVHNTTKRYSLVIVWTESNADCLMPVGSGMRIPNCTLRKTAEAT